jgi:osmotically-inducible protein OsmY
MSSDMQLKNHVEEELTWEPSVNAATVGVVVKDAVITLTGYVGSYAEKHAAERAVSRIRGVKALASELEVRLPGLMERSDEDIARAAANAISWNASVPTGKVTVRVSKGWVTLEGAVEWYYQRAAAERSVRDLLGIKGVTNSIAVKPLPTSVGVKAQIEAALTRNAELDAKSISVETQGSKITLRGTVRSWPERSAAERAAWAAPGVTRVENNIQVGLTASAAW